MVYMMLYPHDGLTHSMSHCELMPDCDLIPGLRAYAGRRANTGLRMPRVTISPRPTRERIWTERSHSTTMSESTIIPRPLDSACCTAGGGPRSANVIST